ncbi:cytochrome P450 [Coprinellus micaceus]|uniref:Cytochrome P450 n=1 Tax=Coprinellus micaceus TaxID=71717 RepID=A0A4Y7SXB0_COPMI|nr:cytochrome P450 [Coprinellus micaceus]
MSSSPFAFISFGVLTCVFLGRQIEKWKAQQLLPPLPPGPPTSLFCGPDFKGQAPWLAYAAWQKEYGDLVYYSYVGNKVLILNSYEAFVELFEKRGNIYSFRARRTMVETVLGFDFMITTMQDDEKWRYFSRNGDKDTGNYNTEQIAHIHSYLRRLLDKPEDFRYSSRRTAAGVMLSLLYGHDVAKEDDHYLFLADVSLKAVVEAGPFGAFMVDYLPWLRFVPTWFPWTAWKRRAMVSRRWIRQALELPFETVTRQLVIGNSLVATELAELQTTHENSRRYTEEIVKNTAATSFMAGSDTTVSLTLSFWLVCTKFPDVQRRAQEEVDRVCPDRLPQLSDRPQMPLIQSMIFELLRWNPATPVGVPHYVRETNVYGDYTIPAGTTIIPNMWIMLHDPKVYPDPFTFKIDRFLGPDGRVDESADKCINPIPDAAVFGVGRRRCPGNYIGMDFVFLMVTNLLKTFQVSKAFDADGQEIDPPAIYTPGLGRYA